MANTLTNSYANTSYANNVFNSSIVLNEDTGCTHISMSRYSPSPVNNSNYTSQGKRKASPSDPIRSQEDITKIKEYLLNNGRTLQIRLRNYALFTLGISIGVRGKDLVRLKIGDVLNPDGSVMDEIKVFESKTRKTIYPFINDTAKDAIISYLDSLPSYSYSDALFSKFGKSVEPMEVDNLYMLMLKIKKDLDLPYHMGAHTLRKTFAYWTIKLHPNDLSTMISLQEMLNHSSMQTTLHYAGQTKDKIKNMYYDLNQVLTDNTIITEPKSENKIDKLFDLFSSIINEEEI